MYVKRVAEAVELVKARAGAMMAPKTADTKGGAEPAPRELVPAAADGTNRRAE
jgi:hypothetical protein